MKLVECFYVSIGLMVLILAVGAICYGLSRLLDWLGN